MKIKSEKHPTFVPRELTITFETQDELDAFGALFNCCTVTTVMNRVTGDSFNSSAIRDAVRQLGGDTLRLHGIFVDRIPN